VLSNRSFIDVALKYFIRVSDNSAHSRRKCLTVGGQRQAVHSGRSSPVRRYECVSLVCSIRSRLITTESLRFSPAHTVSPMTGFMEFNLLFVQLFQLCCHLFKQSVEICGNMSCGQILLQVMIEFIAALATVSAFSFPLIPMWLGIQQKTMDLPFCVSSE